MSNTTLEDVGKEVIDSVLKVHKSLGPGLLESAYQACLAYELENRNFKVDCEVEQPIKYEGKAIKVGYRIDMLVEDCVIIENKVVKKILPIHKAQLLTYMKLRNCNLGYLINWKTQLIKDGITRMIQDYDHKTW
jgi:GxxExxY protein